MTVGVSSRNGMALATSAAFGAGIFSSWTVPLQISELIDKYGWSAAQAGSLGTAQLLALVGAMLLVAPHIPKVRNEVLAYWGCGIAAVGFAVATFAQARPLLLATGFLLGGVGQGFAGVAANGLAAAGEKPERLYSIAIVGGLMFCAICLFIIPLNLLPDVGFSRVFCSCALAMAACCGLIKLAGVRTKPSLHGSVGVPKRALNGAAFALLGGSFLFFAPVTAIWAFADDLGVKLGIPQSRVGQWLSLGAIASIVGPLSMAMSGRRADLRWPIACSFGATGLALFLTCVPVHVPIFLTSIIVQALGQMIVVNMIFALAVRVDTTGRLPALAYSFVLFGCAIGPMLGGLLIGKGVVILGATSLLLCFASWVAIAVFEPATRLKDEQIKSVTALES